MNTENNIRMFEQLGIKITELEAKELAKKVDKARRAKKYPTFENVKQWLTELRSTHGLNNLKDIFRLGADPPPLSKGTFHNPVGMIPEPGRFEQGSNEMADQNFDMRGVTLGIIEPTETCNKCGTTYPVQYVSDDPQPCPQCAKTICVYCGYTHPEDQMTRIPGTNRYKCNGCNPAPSRGQNILPRIA